MKALVGGGIAVALAAVSASAQRATGTIDVGAMGLRYGDSVSAGGLSISPALSYTINRTSVDATGTFSKFGAGLSAQAVLAVSSYTPSWKQLSVELFGSAGGSGHQDGYRTGQARGATRLHFVGSAAGGWGGGGVGAMWDGTQWRQVRMLEAGAWMTRGSAQLLVSSTPTVVDDSIRYVDNQATVGWKASRAELGLTAGFRGGARLPAASDARAWGGVSVAAPISPRASIVVAAGSYPLDFTQGFPAGKYVSAGVRMALGRVKPALGTVAPSTGELGRLEVRRISGEEITISIRAAGADSIEIMGDVTGWEPVRLRPNDRDPREFRVSLAAKPGTSQVNIRVNGGPWVVPPGLTVVKDETGTPVGILVIPAR